MMMKLSWWWCWCWWWWKPASPSIHCLANVSPLCLPVKSMFTIITMVIIAHHTMIHTMIQSHLRGVQNKYQWAKYQLVLCPSNCWYLVWVIIIIIYEMDFRKNSMQHLWDDMILVSWISLAPQSSALSRVAFKYFQSHPSIQSSIQYHSMVIWITLRQTPWMKVEVSREEVKVTRESVDVRRVISDAFS